ncbi:2-amino-4-hydroxy-6-hydroxymethyldihydropteridine diphosphokinase [Planctomicrobium sp. SH668]|uniref:2-amino-4-hydroxy-6- hydroxymethyldihydropteridine diphosphokinase n=1 Tax=Planctomicrobium sp. SH668 TaxID=3448126 RepID=UPI003F5BB012
MMSRLSVAAIAFGGNLGNVPETYQCAVKILNEDSGVRVLKTSRLYATRAVGADAGGDFINGAFLVETERDPLQLLEKLQSIEVQLGRVRTTHWGPRTIDLDLLNFDDQILQLQTATENKPAVSSSLDTRLATLRLPHPGCWYRRFVLDPWCEIQPDWRHPLLVESVLEMRKRIRERPLNVSVGGENDYVDCLTSSLRSGFDSESVVFHVGESHLSSQIRFFVEEAVTSEVAGAREIRVAAESALDRISEVLHAALDAPTPMIAPVESPSL